MNISKKHQVLICLAVFFIIISTQGCQRIRINTEVKAEPSEVAVSYKDHEIGVTPVTIQVDRISELLKISAKDTTKNIMETRIRFLGANKAQVIFRFGTEPSRLARALNLHKVLVFDYSENATFDMNKFALKPELMPLLTKQAALLNKYFPTVPIYICGHTDKTGTEDYNLSLSLKRAQAVADFLAANKIVKGRLKIQGFGEVYPIASNENRNGRALNRRTEIVLPQ